MLSIFRCVYFAETLILLHTAVILNLISGPRNISTALMYSFAQRNDTKVVDEPFYAYYLASTGAEHPGREEVLQSMPADVSTILSDVIFAPQPADILFIKNMAHHLLMRDVSFLMQCTNVFLIRDPKQLIASFAEVMPSPAITDIGLKRQYELFQFLESQLEKAPLVLNSNEVLKNPEKVLRLLCEFIPIPFQESMLSWKAGPIPEDGVWAKYWYENVHRSTSFGQQSTSNRELAWKHRTLYEEALPYYNELNRHAIKA